MKIIKLIFVSISLLLFLPVYSTGLDSCRGAILISKEIKPFIQMVEAVENTLDMPICRVFFDEQSTPYSLDARFKNLDFQSLDFIIAEGPLALKYIKKKQITTQVFYGMVLNPDQIAQNQISKNQIAQKFSETISYGGVN